MVQDSDAQREYERAAESPTVSLSLDEMQRRRPGNRARIDALKAEMEREIAVHDSLRRGLSDIAEGRVSRHDEYLDDE